MTEQLIPRHVAIIMDGNGRWARNRKLPRMAGHRAGVTTVRDVIKGCAERSVEVLTLFAFSSENWRRPTQEVNYLMRLFFSTLKNEAQKLNKQNIQLRIIGDRSRFEPKLCAKIAEVEALTAKNTGLKLVIAANYGGQWDICVAMQKIMHLVLEKRLTISDITPDLIQQHLSLADLPAPDLFIRTSGEYRLSNFMIWQLAYSEMYFTDVLWPDFTVAELEKAFASYAMRERRFGYTGEQLEVERVK